MRFECCGDCGGSGLVPVFAHRVVHAVKFGKPVAVAWAAVAVCRCQAGDRYGDLDVHGSAVARYSADGFCRLPDRFYGPSAATAAEDAAWIRAWLDGRGAARVGEFTADDWRG